MLVQVQRVRLFEDLYGLLELLEFAKRRLLLLQPTGFFNGHLPRVPHRVVNYDTVRTRWQLLKNGHLTLELFLFVTHVRIVKEFRVQVVHDKVTDLYHVKVKLFFAPQKLVALNLAPSHIKQLGEELA